MQHADAATGNRGAQIDQRTEQQRERNKCQAQSKEMNLHRDGGTVLKFREREIQIEADNNAQADQGLLEFGIRSCLNTPLQAFDESGKRQPV